MINVLTAWMKTVMVHFSLLSEIFGDLLDYLNSYKGSCTC